MSVVLAFFVSSFLYASDSATTVTQGTIVSIPDGDTLCIQLENNEYKKVRLQGIDAPENDQPDGEWAGDILRKLALHQPVTVISGKEDKYGRLLGSAQITALSSDECTENLNAKTELNEYMLCKSAAWYYKGFENSYSPANKKRWTAAFDKAKQNQSGLWKPTDTPPTPPWQWRPDHEPVPVPCP